MHPYTHNRAARSGSQSSDDTLVNWDTLPALDEHGRSLKKSDRAPWIRISNLPSAFAKHYPFDESVLEVLDDQLLDRPFESFADDCYAHAISDPDAPPPTYQKAIYGVQSQWLNIEEKQEMHDFIQSPSEPEVEDEVLDITFPQVSRWATQTRPRLHHLNRSQSTNSKRVQFVSIPYPYPYPYPYISFSIILDFFELITKFVFLSKCTGNRNSAQSNITPVLLASFSYQCRFIQFFLPCFAHYNFLCWSGRFCLFHPNTPSPHVSAAPTIKSTFTY